MTRENCSLKIFISRNWYRFCYNLRATDMDTCADISRDVLSKRAGRDLTEFFSEVLLKKNAAQFLSFSYFKTAFQMLVMVRLLHV